MSFLKRVFQSGAFTQKNKFVLVGRIKPKPYKCRVCRLKLGFAFRHTGRASNLANLGISYDYQSVKKSQALSTRTSPSFYPSPFNCLPGIVSPSRQFNGPIFLFPPMWDVYATIIFQSCESRANPRAPALSRKNAETAHRSVIFMSKSLL